MDFNLDINIIDDDDHLEVLDLIDYGISRHVYQRAAHYLTLDDLGFYKRFRLTKETVMKLLPLIDHHLEYLYDTNNCVSPINQLLATLRVYVTGGHLMSIADFVGMHYFTISRIIVRVTIVLASLRNEYIRFPQTEQEKTNAIISFYNIAGFPRVIGVVDGTHIRLQSPGGDDAEIFRNRKNYFSLNTQVICNSKLEVIDIVARWPGSTHDMTIFNNSKIKKLFGDGTFTKYLLLGDNRYQLKQYVLTPFLDSTTIGECRYNKALKQPRITVERMIGVLKRRFPILAYDCRLKLETTMGIVIACAVLHTIAIKFGEVELPQPKGNLQLFKELLEDGQINNIINDDNPGNLIRRKFVTNHFTTL